MKDWLASCAIYSLYREEIFSGRILHSMVRGRRVLRDGELVRESGGINIAR